MDTRTGEMIDGLLFDRLRKEQPATAKWFKEIPNKFLPELEGMNRKERRQWYRKNKHRL